MKKSFYKIFLSSMILLVVIINCAIFINKKEEKYEKEEIKSVLNINTPIIIHEGEKYGLLSQEGEKISEIIYDNISEFYGNYAIVIQNNSYNIIDINGQLMLSNVEGSIEFNNDYNIWIVNEKIYDSNLKQITNDDIKINMYNNFDGIFEFSNSKNNTIGILDYKGKIIYETTNNGQVVEFSPNMNYEFLKRNMYVAVGKNIINAKTGKIIYEICDDCIINSNSVNGIFKIEDKVDKSHKFIFIYNDKVEYENDNVESIELSDYDTLAIDHGYNYNSNNHNVTVEEYKFKVKEKYEKDYFQESTNYLYGFYPEQKEKIGIKIGNELVINYEYDGYDTLNLDIYNYMLQKMNKRLVVMYKNNNGYLIDLNTGLIQKEFINNENLYLTNNGIFIKYQTKDNILIYNIVSGEDKEFNKDSKIVLKNNYFIENSVDGKNNYYNAKFEKVYTSSN